MTLKQYLNRGIDLNREIAIMKEEMKNISESLTRLSINLDSDKIKKSPTTSPLENGVVHMVQLEKEIQDAIEKLATIGSETMLVINKLDDYNSRTLLIKRYVGYKSWETIAQEMNISRRGAQNKYYYALNKLEFLMKDSPLLEVANET